MTSARPRESGDGREISVDLRRQKRQPLGTCCAAAAALPLLLPLPGIVMLRPRALVWGGYLALLYFMFGVMEWWSAPGQWLMAAAETVLSTAYLLALARATRKQRRPKSGHAR